jgi:ABC-2 type transport system permease protein
MINEIKAEVRKVFTIRSTYVIFAVMLFFIIFFGFYVAGWHTDKVDLLDPHRLYRIAQQSISFLSIFIALIAVLLLTHEFRYNTIAYSLTSSNNRSKVLAAKILVVTALALIATTIVGLASPLLADWGMHVHHLKLAPQTFYYSGLAWRGLVFGWGYAMAGLLFAALIRNQIGAIITLFIVPDTVEGLLSILLKNNTVYLPFSALHSMLGVGMDVPNGHITPIHAMYVFLGYLLVGWAIAWYLFLKRDAG